MLSRPVQVLKTFTGAGELVDRRGNRRRIHYSLDLLERRRWGTGQEAPPPRGHGSLAFAGDLYVGNPADNLVLDAPLTLHLAGGGTVEIQVEREVRSDLPWRFVVIGPVPV
jgi:hypothetical protein